MSGRRTLALLSFAASISLGALPAAAQSTADRSPGFSAHYESEPAGWLYNREGSEAASLFSGSSYLTRRVALRAHDMRGVSAQFYLPIDRSAFAAMVDVAVVHGRVDFSDCTASSPGVPRPAASGYCSRGNADAASWHAALNVSRAFALASPTSLDLAAGGGLAAFGTSNRKCFGQIDPIDCDRGASASMHRPEAQATATLHQFAGRVGLSLRVSDALSFVSVANAQSQAASGGIVTSPRLPASLHQELSVGLGVYVGPR